MYVPRVGMCRVARARADRDRVGDGVVREPERPRDRDLFGQLQTKNIMTGFRGLRVAKKGYF